MTNLMTNNSPTPEEIQSYINGLDELAESLGVQPNSKYIGITLRGKKGDYDFVELVNAHISMMKKSMEKFND